MSARGAHNVPVGQASLFDGSRVRMCYCGDGEAGINTVFFKSERNRRPNRGPLSSNSHQNV